MNVRGASLRVASRWRDLGAVAAIAVANVLIPRLGEARKP
jgi:hypothetical protein